MMKDQATEPFIALRKGIRVIKKETSFHVRGAPPLTNKLGDIFSPWKIVIIDFGDRACVEVTGPMGRGYGYRNECFNLHDYSYSSCPEWLIPLIREAGYDQEIQ